MKRMVLLGLVLIAWVMAGCASYTTQNVPSQLEENKTVRAEKEDISITVFPILTKEDSKKYFDANLPGDNIMAIFVNILNTSPDVVEISAAKLSTLPRQYVLEPLQVEDVYKSSKREYVGKASLWMVLTYFVGAPVSALHTRSVNKDIEIDLQGKALKLGDVKPKTYIHGFLWFKIPDGAIGENKKLPRSELRVIANKNGKAIDFVLPIPEPPPS